MMLFVEGFDGADEHEPTPRGGSLFTRLARFNTERMLLEDFLAQLDRAGGLDIESQLDDPYDVDAHGFPLCRIVVTDLAIFMATMVQWHKQFAFVHIDAIVHHQTPWLTLRLRSYKLRVLC